MKGNVVLFTSNKSFERAENLRAVYDAYDGEKEFFRTDPWGAQPDYSTGKYALLVADEFPLGTPGKCIFIGHGIGAGKTGGLDQPYPYYRNNGYLTYCLASSRHQIPIIARSCGVPESSVMPTGMPRTDWYFGDRPARSDKRTYLYLPTYRTKEEYVSTTIDWDYLDGQLKDHEQLIVKPHMMTKHILDGTYKHIAEADWEEPTTPYLLSADVVITDYSSIMFDAYICRIPVVLFEKDHEQYLRERGMYYQYPAEYSELHCRNESQLIMLLRSAEWNSYFEDRREFYTEYCDGQSARRVCDLIRSLL